MKRYQKLRQEIKDLSEGQTLLKDQRKMVYNKMERIMPAHQAASKHQINRERLRHLYVAYGMLRNMSLDFIEPSRKTEPDMDLVQKIMDRHYEEVVRTPSE